MTLERLRALAFEAHCRVLTNATPSRCYVSVWAHDGSGRLLGRAIACGHGTTYDQAAADCVDQLPDELSDAQRRQERIAAILGG